MTAENIQITSLGTVDPKEEFFQDHFPGFPILPGVLMIEILKKTAEEHLGGSKLRMTELRNVKYANFLKPGDAWESSLELQKEEAGLFSWKGKLSTQGRIVCTAQFQLQKQ